MKDASKYVQIGGPLDISFAQVHPRIASLIKSSYLGEAGGRELAGIISGDDNRVESYQCSSSLHVTEKKVKPFDGPSDVKAIQTPKESS
nr:probable beta-D-xylosidase 6 [Tanacetum cinerariifolium]